LEHGLVVSLTESSGSWQIPATLYVGANRSDDGVYNTNLMINSSAKNYVTNLGLGWYLPSIDELGLLYYNRYTVQKALRAGNHTLLSINDHYWSSTEDNFNNAQVFTFRQGFANYYYKTQAGLLRGIRAF
jgi:hypothetical protein